MPTIKDTLQQELHAIFVSADNSAELTNQLDPKADDNQADQANVSAEVGEESVAAMSLPAVLAAVGEPSTNGVRAQLVVNKSDEFFIAIATKGVHSFVMLGNMHHGKPRILARVGKVAAQSSDSGCKIITKMVLLQTNAVLQEESIFPGGAISYAAYSINFQQYLQFTKAIGVAMGEESISCYQPLSEESDSLTLQYRQIARVEKATEQDEHLIASTHGLSIANTCRHTAIDLIEYAQGNRLSANVSRVFFRNLPVKTTFDYG